jgi:hypothetical protein
MKKLKHLIRSLTAAFLFLKFLPNDPQSSNPWIRLGFRNILNQADVHINGLRFNIPFYSTFPTEYLTIKD